MFIVNDQVRTRIEARGDRVGGDGGYYGNVDRTVEAGSVGRVTRAGTHSSLVRFRGQNGGDPFSIWVNNHNLEYDSSTVPTVGPKRRQPGIKPEGDEYLDPRDPRLEWFWDDVSELAPKTSYCHVFDEILAKLNMPPRKQLFTAAGTLGNMQVTARIMARTQQEANQKFTAQLADEVLKAAEAAAVDIATEDAIRDSEGEAE